MTESTSTVSLKKQLTSDRNNRPKSPPVVVANIPDELKQLPQWVIWRWTWDEEGKYWDKPPWKPRGGGMASHSNPATWSDFAAAWKTYQAGAADGVGFNLGIDGGPYVGVDLDNCRDPKTGSIAEWVKAIVASLRTYGEISPTGTGIKLFARADVKLGWHRKPFRTGEIEIYSSHRYFTITGTRAEGCPPEIHECTAEMKALIAEVEQAQPKASVAKKKASSSLSGLKVIAGPADLTDDEVLDKARRSNNGAKFDRLWRGATSDHDGDQSRADLALCSYLRFYGGAEASRIDRLFRQSGLMREKWGEPHYADGETYGSHTINLALPGDVWQPSCNGHAGENQASHDTEFIASLLELAEIGPNTAIDKAFTAEGLAALGRAKLDTPGTVERLCRLLQQSGATARAVEQLYRAVSQAAKNISRERKKEAKDRLRKALDVTAVETPTLQNFREEEILTDKSEVSVVRVGLPAETIAARLHELTGGWPRRVGSILFATAEGPSPLWLDSTAKLFGWIQSQLPAGNRNALRWASQHDMETPERFHAYLSQKAECFKAVEPFPHEPPIDGHFYMHPPSTDGDGSSLRKLVNFFHPAADVDRHLIEAFFLTLFWGGAPGTRPAWLFTGDENDEKGGRGIGKTSVVKAAARLVGGYLAVDHDERMTDVVKRLLSDEGMVSRLVLLDNLKTLKFSWGQLEGLVTGDVISGHRMYAGEGRRPNTLVWALTLNGASLSRDMATRCVIVKLSRPTYRATWEEELSAFIDENRWRIIGDCLARLRSPAARLNNHGRWGQWEDGVLSRLADPSNCQRVILDHQGEVDEDTGEAEIIRDFFAYQIKSRKLDPDKCRVFIPSRLAGKWTNLATGETRPLNRACAYLNQLPGAKCVRKSADTQGGRGFVWEGKEATADEPAKDIEKYPEPISSIKAE